MADETMPVRLQLPMMADLLERIDTGPRDLDAYGIHS